MAGGTHAVEHVRRCYRLIAADSMTPYGERALDGELAALRAAGNGSRNEQLNRAAFAIGQLVGGRQLEPVSAKAALTEAARTAGLDPREIAVTLESGWEAGTLEPRAPEAKPGNAAPARRPQRVASFEYQDAHGVTLYRNVRMEPGHDGGRKSFIHEHPDGAGGWAKGRGGDPVPYRLPDLRAAAADAIVFTTEGEAKADRLASWGLVATSHKGWKGDWHVLCGRRVVILPDRDKSGAQQAERALKALRPQCSRVAVLTLPRLTRDGADVLDWDGDATELEALALAALEAPEPEPAPNQSGADPRAEVSEDAIALDFTARHRETLRFDHSIGSWFEWDGERWSRDGCSRAFHYARQIGRTLGKGERATCKAAVAGGAERFARADPAHAVEATYWDRDPWLLGTPGGTVDLRTGRLRRARPDDAITKLAGATPEPGSPELWLRFLHESFCGDAELVRFAQQWFGYTLTGDTREHALAFAHGGGGNGKSVWLNTKLAIVGDYAVTATMETFTASRGDRHSTELAMLRGARLVTASETEEGRAWAEARLKALTGGDPITARFMRQDNFTFHPEFKLTIVGNHAPALVNVDDAMRRRFNIVPFINKPAAPDRELEQKLRAEHGRILAWAIEGCLDWQANGLIRPAAVKAATAEYFEGEDLLGQWLAERCEVGRQRWELPARLYADWKAFATENGEAVGTNTDFGKRLTAKGFPSKASCGVRKRVGLSLNSTGASA